MGKTLDLKVEIEQKLLELHLETPHVGTETNQGRIEKIYHLFKLHNKNWVERTWSVLNDFNNLKNMNKVKNQNMRSMRSALSKIEDILESDTNQLKADIEIALGEYYERLENNFCRYEDNRREFNASKKEAHQQRVQGGSPHRLQ